jgi:hypothetical protein
MNAELDYTPPFELWKTDHGTDGWDARTWLVGRFTKRSKALAYLTARGYDFEQGGYFWHIDEAHRCTMGAISYEIREVKTEVPVDPE